MTPLAELVRTSSQVAGTSSRLGKIAALGQLLRRLAPEEIAIALPYLSGDIRQGRLGLEKVARRFHSQCVATTIRPGTGALFSVRVEADSRLTIFSSAAASAARTCASPWA